MGKEIGMDDRSTLIGKREEEMGERIGYDDGRMMRGER